MKKLIFLVFLSFSFFGCNKKSNNNYSVDMVAACKMPAKEYNYDSEVMVDTAAAVVDSVATASTSNEEKNKTIQPKIIKNGNLRFETNDLDATYKQIQGTVEKVKGIILSDSESKSNYSLDRSLRIKIPSDKFDAFISEISKGVDYFDTKEVSSEDVTEEYIDIEARVKTKKVLEQRYLELLKKANKVSEMLEVEKQLSTIREEIEAKEGRLKYIQNRVSMSTISIDFYKSIANNGGASASFGAKIWNAIKSGFNSIISFFILLIENWPFIIILVAIIYFIRKRIKNKHRRNA